MNTVLAPTKRLRQLFPCSLDEQLTRVLNDIEKKVNKEKMSPDEKTDLKLNIGKIPQIIFDNTDRNRTSPFAFTGDKFEFRPVGASANCSPVNDSAECSSWLIN